MATSGSNRMRSTGTSVCSCLSRITVGLCKDDPHPFGGLPGRGYPPAPVADRTRPMSVRRLLLASWFIAASAVFLPLAHAAESPEAGELRRLQDEMQKLAERSAWKGVDRAYRQLEALDTEATYAD